MKHIFFNIDHSIDEVAQIVFGSLGIDNFVEGDSANVKDGIYYVSSVLGVKIKLEGNSYDYDNQYGYMLAIKQDGPSMIYSNDLIVAEIANVVIKILKATFETAIAYKNNDNALQLYSDLTLKAFETLPPNL
jgi:hypothetical protein